MLLSEQEQPMGAEKIQLDSSHCRAICDEIGERLRMILDRDAAPLPPRLQVLMLRLFEQELNQSPSVAPAIEDMVRALELAETSGLEGALGFLWNSIGAVRMEQDKMTEAVNSFERAVTAHERAGKSEHPDLIAALTNLGAAYLAEGHVKQAQTALARARSLVERSFGVSHPALYQILMLEARVLDRLNRKAEAKQSRRRAQTISRNKGPRDPSAFVVDIEDLRRR